MKNTSHPRVGIVGSRGAYGRWLTQFFQTKMKLEVMGYDPAPAEDDSTSHSLEDLLERADVLLFSAPIRHTSAIIADCVQRSAGREHGRLWLDITSIKVEPVKAMLASNASVVGLHPMTAPPVAPTLKGRKLVVCQARLQAHWENWLEQLYEALEAECVPSNPKDHDQTMALVQSMVHATHLVQAGVLRHYVPVLGHLQKLMQYRSTNFALDVAIIARILTQNPAIYEDIQFCNPYSAQVLDQLLNQLNQLRQLIKQGDDQARVNFRQQFLHDNKQAIDETTLRESRVSFEQLDYLLTDLNQPRFMHVRWFDDESGGLMNLLKIFEKYEVNLLSLHSSHTPKNELYFRIGFNKKEPSKEILETVKNQINNGEKGIVMKYRFD